MSRTEIKNGSRVQRALHAISAGKGIDGANRLVTVGEVAKEAGCSRPTAKKYLELLLTFDVAGYYPDLVRYPVYFWKGA